MNGEVTEPAPEGDRPPADDLGFRQPQDHTDKAILPTIPAFAVLARTRYGGDWRRVYLSLHAATKAVERFRARGCAAGLVLVRLEPIDVADLDGDPS